MAMVSFILAILQEEKEEEGGSLETLRPIALITAQRFEGAIRSRASSLMIENVLHSKGMSHFQSEVFINTSEDSLHGSLFFDRQLGRLCLRYRYEDLVHCMEEAKSTALAGKKTSEYRFIYVFYFALLPHDVSGLNYIQEKTPIQRKAFMVAKEKDPDKIVKHGSNSLASLPLRADGSLDIFSMAKIRKSEQPKDCYSTATEVAPYEQELTETKVAFQDLVLTNPWLGCLTTCVNMSAMLIPYLLTMPYTLKAAKTTTELAVPGSPFVVKHYTGRHTSEIEPDITPQLLKTVEFEVLKEDFTNDKRPQGMTIVPNTTTESELMMQFSTIEPLNPIVEVEVFTKLRQGILPQSMRANRIETTYVGELYEGTVNTVSALSSFWYTMDEKEPQERDFNVRVIKTGITGFSGPPQGGMILCLKKSTFKRLRTPSRTEDNRGYPYTSIARLVMPHGKDYNLGIVMKDGHTTKYIVEEAELDEVVRLFKRKIDCEVDDKRMKEVKLCPPESKALSLRTRIIARNHIAEKYPNKVLVRVLRHAKCTNLPDLVNSWFVLDRKSTIRTLIFELRRHLPLSLEERVSCIQTIVLCTPDAEYQPTDEPIGQLYTQFAQEDQILYLWYRDVA